VTDEPVEIGARGPQRRKSAASERRSPAGEAGDRMEIAAMNDSQHPITRPDRGYRLFRELVDIAERYRRGRLVVAEALGISPAAIDDLVELDLAVQDEKTLERRAAEAGNERA